MNVMLIMIGAIALMAGSMIAGILSCWLLWSVFRRVGHPEWGPPIMLLPVGLALAGQLPKNDFLVLSLVFASLGIIPFCAEGIAWRKRQLNHDCPRPHGRSIGTQDLSGPKTYLCYPAIVGCICEERRATPIEVKRVAARILREAIGARQADLSFARKRIALLAAKVALEGSGSDRLNA
jgi:hypothetical protein